MTDPTPPPPHQPWNRADKISTWALVFGVAGAGISIAFALGGDSAQVATLKTELDSLKAWQKTAEGAIQRMGTSSLAEVEANQKQMLRAWEDPATGWESTGVRLRELAAVDLDLYERMAIIEGRVGGHDKALTQQVQLIEANKEAIRVLDGPIGAIAAWPSAKPAPRGWHVCDGSLLDIIGPKDPLYLALGETYGGSPQGKVKLPDFRGYFLRGAGEAASGPGSTADLNSRSKPGVGSTQGWSTGAPINGANNGHAKIGNESRSASGVTWVAAGAETSVSCGDGAFDNETRPANYAVHWIIRVK